MSNNAARLYPDTVANAIQVFPGAKVVAVNKPLFCGHCDKQLIAQWDGLYPTDSAKELVALLLQRKGGVVERIWPDACREWACHFCGRAMEI